MPARAMLDLYHAVFQNTSDAMVVCNREGEIILLNHSASENLRSAHPEDTAGVAVNFGMYIGDGSRLLAVDEMPMSRAIKGERVRDFSIVLRNDYVGERRVIVDSDPIYDEATPS